ncbi:MAG TPA: hypothetical protein VK524_15835, partial [Polyangiaceae bacterium]|nr:hypothetical protein [Polyangiaceae bacterium]
MNGVNWRVRAGGLVLGLSAVACSGVAAEASSDAEAKAAFSGTSITAEALVLSDFEVADTELRAARAAAGDIASNGTLSLMVSAEPGLPSRVLATRLGKDGAVLDSKALILGEASGGASTARVAADGTDFLVAWSGAGFVHTAHVSADGGASPVSRVGADVDGPNDPVGIASNGSNYLIAWASNGTLYAARVTRLGMPIEPTPIALGAGSGTPAVSAVGSSYLVAWTGPGAQAAPSIFGARVDAGTGKLLSPAGLVLAEGGGALLSAPALAHHGELSILAWTASNGLFARRFAGTGAALDPVTGFQIAPYSADPTGHTARPKLALAASEQGFFALWDEAELLSGCPFGCSLRDAQGEYVLFPAPTLHRVKGVRLGTDGSMTGEPLTLTEPWLPKTGSDIGDLWHPRLAFDGKRYVAHLLGRDCTSTSDCPVVTRERYTGETEALISTDAARWLYSLSSTGEAVGGARLSLTLHTQQQNPHIAASSTGFGVLLSDDYDHSGARGLFVRLDPTGQRLTSESAARFMDTVTPSSGNWLLSGNRIEKVWAEFGCNCILDWPYPHIQLATDGGTLAPPTSFPGTAVGALIAQTLAAASDGRDFGLLAWYGPFGPPQMSFWKVNADGTFAGEGRPFWPIPTNNAIGALAFGGGRYLALWTDGNTLYGGRVATDGSAIDANAFTVSARGVRPESLRAASDGTDFLAVWLERGAQVWGARIGS